MKNWMRKSLNPNYDKTKHTSPESSKKNKSSKDFASKNYSSPETPEQERADSIFGPHDTHQQIVDTMSKEIEKKMLKTGLNWSDAYEERIAELNDDDCNRYTAAREWQDKQPQSPAQAPYGAPALSPYKYYESPALSPFKVEPGPVTYDTGQARYESLVGEQLTESAPPGWDNLKFASDQLSPLDTVKTLPELLNLIPAEDRQALRKAYERAETAEKRAKEEWIKKPDNDLVALVDDHYVVKSTSPESGFLVPGYSFTSKKYPSDNYADISLSEDKSTLVSYTLYRGRKKDMIRISDLQRYTCIKLDKIQGSINSHKILSYEGNASEILKILYKANAIFSQGQATNDTLNLSKKSAAFRVLRGTEVNLSTIFLFPSDGLIGQDMRHLDKI